VISDQELARSVEHYDKTEAAIYVARGRAHGHLSDAELEQRLTSELRSLVASGLSWRWQPVFDVLCEYKLRGLRPGQGEAWHLFYRAARMHMPTVFSDPVPLNG
jgi:hypothetical protein